MLVFSAFTPHPPLLIPTIGKNNLDKLESTLKTMQNLEHELYQAKPNTVIIISPHSPLMDDAFTINLFTQYVGQFEEFGDLTTKQKFKPDIALVHQIKEFMEAKIPIQMISDKQLDHGISVPLYYLMQHLSNVAIIPIGYSSLDSNTHFQFGQSIRQLIEPHNKRIAVIASGDLSHALSEDSPAGFSAQGKEFDNKIIEFLKEKKIDHIIGMNPELIQAASECGLRSLIILLGILNSSNWQAEILSYQAPFGVGYLVCHFKLNR